MPDANFLAKKHNSSSESSDNIMIDNKVPGLSCQNARKGNKFPRRYAEQSSLDDWIYKLVWEGGGSFISYMLNQAIPDESLLSAV